MAGRRPQKRVAVLVVVLLDRALLVEEAPETAAAAPVRRLAAVVAFQTAPAAPALPQGRPPLEGRTVRGLRCPARLTVAGWVVVQDGRRRRPSGTPLEEVDEEEGGGIQLPLLRRPGRAARPADEVRGRLGGL